MGDEEMKLKSLGIALAGLILSSAAQAADIPPPVYKGVRPVVAYYNWTGFYVGISGGYGFGESTWSSPVANLEPTGYLIGGTIGYNYQVGSIVWGFEGDWSWADINASAACPPGTVGVTCETRLTWLATFRGRLGYAFDRWLPYITAGGAYGNVEANMNPGADASNSQFGWTAGVGLEYAFAGNWSAKLEYLYVDLGSFNAATAPAPANDVSFNANIIRAGLNYRFSGPIFSRY
jgi:outer membrane immunogenic protein